jgi:membrane protein implicated in regulation of membrane protease activity
MKRKIYTYLSAGTLVAGAAAGGYALIRTFLLRAALPAGTCPVVHYSPFIYTAIAFCVLSFVFTLLEQRAKKRTAGS